MQIANLKQKFRKHIRAKQIGEIKERKRSQLLANALNADTVREESSCSTSRSSSTHSQIIRVIACFEQQAIRRINEGEDSWAGEYGLSDANRTIEKLNCMQDEGKTFTTEYFLTVTEICLRREYFQLLNYKIQGYFSILSGRFYYFFEVALRQAIQNNEDEQKKVLQELEELWIAVEKVLTRELTKLAEENKVHELCQIILSRKINFMLDNQLLNCHEILSINMNRFLGILFMRSATIAISNEVMNSLVLLVKDADDIRRKMLEDLTNLKGFLTWHLLLIKQSAQDNIEVNGQLTDPELKENFNLVLLLLNTICSEGQELVLGEQVYENIIEIGILSISAPPSKEVLRDLFIFIESYGVYKIPHFCKAISMICYEAIILEVGHELELVAIELLGLMQERGRTALQKLEIHYAYCMKQKKQCFQLLSDCLSSIRNRLGYDEELDRQDALVKSL